MIVPISISKCGKFYKNTKYSLYVSLIYLTKIFSINLLNQCTEVRFAGFLSDGFTIMAVINPPEKKLEKRTSVQWGAGNVYPLSII